jgi:endonuclease/exonuclease/phosphatase family metal-dependent hydrolase
MEEICTGDFRPPSGLANLPPTLCVVNWNLDRGLRFRAIVEFLTAQQADLIILQEVDVNARRTLCLNIAEELARHLKMNYVFAQEFVELTQETPRGKALHGQATLSRYAQSSVRLIRFRQQSDFWRPRWFVPRIHPFQQRLGGRIALISDLRLTERETLTVYNLHLESRGSDRLRLSQLQEVIDDAHRQSFRNPMILAGDFNFDVLKYKPAASIVEQCGLRSVLSTRAAAQATTRRGFLRPSRCIDWVFTSGSMALTSTRIHNGIDASDHYPISFFLERASMGANSRAKSICGVAT